MRSKKLPYTLQVSSITLSIFPTERDDESQTNASNPILGNSQDSVMALKVAFQQREIASAGWDDKIEGGRGRGAALG
ncbi:hypothetical protein KM043_010962 [Ampulex compressa]|nr:hypothetical protein KM043_010962 [Ampulex compressa]